MAISRLQIKFFAANPVDLAVFTGLFQRWIQQKRLDGLLIDVADYRHVFQGPGVILIGYESDYGMDMGAGRLGLLYTRKRRHDADLQQQLRSSFYLALAACHALETEPEVAGKLKFRTDEVEIRFADRLRLPNTTDAIEKVRDDLNAVLAEIYEGAPVSLAVLGDDSRQVFTVRATVQDAGSVTQLFRRLQSLGATAGFEAAIAG